MAAHVDHVVGHAEKKAVAIIRLIPNIGGPGDTKDICDGGQIGNHVRSPCIDEGVENKSLQKKLKRLNRPLAIRVIAGLPRLELLAIEKDDIEKGTSKETSRKDLLANWQMRWNEERCWTKEPIKNIEPWTNRGHGELNYKLCTVLTGHGIFNTYRTRIKKMKQVSAGSVNRK
ncbi:hypothetical protein Zmor_015408 [Zophobas morio]|uniref:Uncharacterized protein n=1 Tax=Zophobas morio TaxID=2755281 RepID=A0AA38IMK4_9CUCU|nr:hypothetical protein Zmor_015408 [Zophobas morio]